MNANQFLKEFAVFFSLMFVVNLVITYIWNLISHGAGSIDWPRSIIFPIIWAVMIPIANATIIKKTHS